MAMSFSRPDPSSPTTVASAAFSQSRKGFDQAEVRDFLRMVAAELARLQEREKFLERELRTAQRGGVAPTSAIDEELVARLLGDEAVKVLQSAREAASQIKNRAEEGAARLLRDATEEAQRLREDSEVEAARRRSDAASDAEAELQMARQQGREMVEEARAYRERVLTELNRRREIARQQIEQLVHGRDRLLQSFERARIAAVDVIAEMAPVGEPDEFVNLTPTTGPVPLMVPAAAVSPVIETPVVEVEPEVVPEPEAVVEVEPEAELAPEVEVATAATVEAVSEPEATVIDLESAVAAPEIEPEPEVDEPRLAPVVSLFSGTPEPPMPPSAPTSEATKSAVDDLFARLKAARPHTVAERAAEASEAAAVVPATSTSTPEVFRTSPEAPTTTVAYEDTPFGRRDAELTPLIVAAARKLKRVLADEQNDVLHLLRSARGVQAVNDLLGSDTAQIRRYSEAVDEELRAAALAGAASVDDGKPAARAKLLAKSDAVQKSVDALAAAIVRPLRERIERALAETGGEGSEMSTVVRAVYREWKTQRIDEYFDDIARTAFGRGALAVLAPGTKICWAVDPNGPACPDAEDNSLAGEVEAGQPFPTDHLCAPAHEGCRCMLVRAPR